MVGEVKGSAYSYLSTTSLGPISETLHLNSFTGDAQVAVGSAVVKNEGLH